MTTTTAPAAAAAKNAIIRSLEEAENLSPYVLHKWETNQGYKKNGQPIRPTIEIKLLEITEHTPKHYPVTWQNGRNFIFEIQSEYWQQEDEEGNKGAGYCRTYIFCTVGAEAAAAAIAKGAHPSRHGYNLCRI